MTQDDELIARIALGKRNGLAVGLWRRFAQVIIFYFAYVLAGGLGQSLAIIPGVAITFWPPAGIFVAMLLLNPWRTWPSWIVAACAAELTCNAIWFHNSIPFALIYFAANALTAVIAAALLRRFAPKLHEMQSLEDVALFAVLGAGVAPLASATVIATTDALIGKHAFATAWPLVWLGDASGLLVSSPLALVAVETWRRRGDIDKRRLLEAVVVLALLSGCGVLVFREQLPVYTLMPLILWMSARFYLAGAAVAVPVVALMIAVYTRFGRGDLAALSQPAVQAEIVSLQIFLAVCAVSALLVAAIGLQRRRAIDRLATLHAELERRFALRTAELSASEERLRQYITNAPAAIALFDLQMRYVVANRRWIDEFNLSGQTVVGRSHYEVFPEIPEHWRRVHQRAMAGEIISAAEDRFDRADGSTQWLRWEVRPWHTADGGIGGIAIFTEDLTARKQTEERVRMSEARLRLALEASCTGLWTWNLSTDAVTWTPECYRIHGLTEGTFEGTGAAFFRLVHPDDRARVEAAVRGAAERHELYECEFRIRRPDGREVWVANRGRGNFDDAGRPIGMVGTIIDVDARRAAEEQLRASEQFNRSLMEGSSDCLKVLDLAGRLLHMNGPGLCQMEIDDFGPLCGREWPDLWPPEARGEIRRAVDRARAGEPTSFEAFCPTAKGTPKWWEVAVSPVLGDDGRPARLLSASRDITARKAAEQALVVQKRLLESITDNASTALFIMDEQQKCVFMNPAAEHLTGFTQEEVIRRGGALHDIIHHTRPDGRPYPLSECPIDQAFPTQNQMKGEEVFVHKAGHFYPVEFTASPIRDESGKTVGTIVEVQDITARKAAEQAVHEARMFLASTFNALATHVAIIDEHGVILMVNLAWQRFAEHNGYSDRGDGGKAAGVGEDYLRVCDRAHAAGCAEGGAVADGLREMLRGQRQSFELEYPCHAPEGEARWFYLRAARFEFGGSSASVRIVLAHENITSRKLIEQALQDADRRKDAFLATLAHELRNPLAPLVNSLEILKRAGDNRAMVEKSRQTMHRQLNHVVRLVDDLLDVSRITQDKLTLRLERVELAPIVRHAVESARPLCEQAGHQLHVHIPQLPIWINADAVRLAQVIGNLLTNACKYTPKGGTISLAVATRQREVSISVKDNGFGIAEDLLTKIFEPFTQVHTSMEESRSGLGIGLALVKRLVEMHGGTVEAHSDGPGQGSEFVVRLPRGVQDDSADEFSEHAAAANSGG